MSLIRLGQKSLWADTEARRFPTRIFPSSRLASAGSRDRQLSVRAVCFIALFKFFAGANGFWVGHAVQRQDSIQMINFVLKQLGEIPLFSSLNLMELSLKILILDRDVAVPFDPHENGQKAEASIPNDNSFRTTLDDFRIDKRPRCFAR